MPELSSEDSFRLNVLLANKPLAIRIDESKMIVRGLFERGESKVSLNPTGRSEHYLRKVKELISGHVLGSPGGYPIYLRRWTRMGQMRDESLEQLLVLGEPEAVVAAVCSPGLTDELARRAWWVMEDVENARSMLGNPAIVAGDMGKILAAYLVEYLPFETETEKMMESIRLVLQPGLLGEADRLSLWKKSIRKQAYLVGFLQAIPDDLPDRIPARRDAARFEKTLGALAESGNPCASLLMRILSSPGQTFLDALAGVLAKPPTQDVIYAILELVRNYFSPMRPEGAPDAALTELFEDSRGFANSVEAPDSVRLCCEAVRDLSAEVDAMRLLSGVGYGVLRPALGDSTASGSLMRRKLKPVTDPLLAQIGLLLGKGG